MLFKGPGQQEASIITGLQSLMPVGITSGLYSKSSKVQYMHLVLTQCCISANVRLTALHAHNATSNRVLPSPSTDSMQDAVHDAPMPSTSSRTAVLM